MASKFTGMISNRSNRSRPSPHNVLEDVASFSERLPDFLLEPSVAAKDCELDDSQWTFILAGTNPLMGLNQACHGDLSTASFPFTDPTIPKQELVSLQGFGKSTRYVKGSNTITAGPDKTQTVGTDAGEFMFSPPSMSHIPILNIGDRDLNRIPNSKNEAASKQATDLEDNIQDSLLDELLGNDYSPSLASSRETDQAVKESIALTKEERALRRRAFHKVHTRRSRAKLNDKMDHLRRVLPSPPPGTCVKSKAQILDWAIACASAQRLSAPPCTGDPISTGEILPLSALNSGESALYRQTS